MTSMRQPRRGRGRFWLGLGAGLLLVAFVLCGLAYLVTQPNVSFVTGPAWTPPARPPDAATDVAETVATPGAPGIQIGGRAMVSPDVNRANLRRSAGYVNKPGNDVLGTVPGGAILDVLSGPQPADSLQWWQVRYRDQVGWMAETRAGGEPLLEPAP